MGLVPFTISIGISETLIAAYCVRSTNSATAGGSITVRFESIVYSNNSSARGFEYPRHRECATVFIDGDTAHRYRSDQLTLHRKLISCAPAVPASSTTSTITISISLPGFITTAPMLYRHPSHITMPALGHYYPTNCPIAPQYISANSTTRCHGILGPMRLT